MACAYTKTNTLGCKTVAGVSIAYIGAFTANTTTCTYDANNQITGFTTAPTFYTIQQVPEQASFTVPGEHNIANQTNAWKPTLSLVFHRYDSTMRDLVYALAIARVMAVVKANDGNYYLLGETNGLDLSASDPQQGKMLVDNNGAAVTLVGVEAQPCRLITSAAFSTLTIV